MFNRVVQEHSRGCGAACVAILVGRTYTDVVSRFPNHNFELAGYLIEAMLHEFGYEVTDKNTKRHFDGEGGVARIPWPPKPWADVHFALVLVKKGANCYHWVIWLRDGTIIDPMLDGDRKFSDYEDLLQVFVPTLKAEDSK